MTLEQLRIFVAVAERQHMSRAAEALNLTQSAASAAVAALEHRYGARLFDRVGRGLTLSAVGRAFLPEARAVLAQARIAAAALDDLGEMRRGRIILYASQTLSSYWLPPHLVAFATAYPKVEVSLTVGNTAGVARALLEGEAELGLVEGAVAAPLLVQETVGHDRLAIVVAPGHPLARAAEVRWRDLADLAWVLREPGSGTRSEFEQAALRGGLDPAGLHALLELPSNESVLAAAASGGLVAAVSELAAQPMIAAGRIHRLPLAVATRTCELLTHTQRSRTRAAAAFIALLKSRPDAMS